MNRKCKTSGMIALIFQLLAVGRVNAADEKAQASYPFGEASEGLAVRLTPLPKDDLAPFAFEVTAKNSGQNALTLFNAKNAEEWSFSFEPAGGPAYRVQVVEKFSSTMGGQSPHMKLSPSQTETVSIKYSLGHCRLKDNASVVPLTELPPGKYRVTASYPRFKLSVNGMPNPYQGKAVSNMIEIEIMPPQNRPSRKEGFGLPTWNLSAHLALTSSRAAAPLNFDISFRNEGGATSVLRHYEDWQWKFRFDPVDAVRPEAFIVSFDPGATKNSKTESKIGMSLADKQAVSRKFRLDDQWTFEQNGKISPVSALPQGVYHVTAWLSHEEVKSDKKLKIGESYWFGTLVSNTVKVETVTK